MKKDEWKREHGCTRKRAFQTRFYAECYARNGLKNPDLKAYRCPFCKEWHLTTNKNGDGRTDKRRNS